MSLRVSEERWKAAQKWELSEWAERDHFLFRQLLKFRYLLGRVTRSQVTLAGDDWNQWWSEEFDNYQVLPHRMARAIELGCGPYTNIRLISQRIHIESIVCADPLVEHYIRFTQGWLAKAYREGRIKIDSRPIESIGSSEAPFDLVVLINVLDHVQDAELGMRNVIDLVKPQGYLILGQDLTNQEDLAVVARDLGHPIRVNQEWLDILLRPSFEPLLYRILPRQAGRNPRAHYGTYLLIGRKYGWG